MLAYVLSKLYINIIKLGLSRIYIMMLYFFHWTMQSQLFAHIITESPKWFKSLHDIPVVCFCKNVFICWADIYGGLAGPWECSGEERPPSVWLPPLVGCWSQESHRHSGASRLPPAVLWGRVVRGSCTLSGPACPLEFPGFSVLQINWKLLLWLPAGRGLMSVWFRSMTRWV